MRGSRWLVVISLLFHSVAFAQGSPAAPSDVARQEAAEHFERGVQLFREQAFRAALVEFQRAYDLAPDYRLLYNLGRTKYQLQDYLGAAQNYESYLAQGGSEVPPDRRAQVEDTLAALRNRVGRISVTVNREGAEVFLDDVKIGTSPLASLVLTNVGRHRVSARASDGAVGAEFVDVAGGDIAEVSLTLAEERVAAAAGGNLATEVRDRPWSLSRKAALGLWIGGGAVLAGSIVTGVMSLQTRNSFEDKLGTLGVSHDVVEDERTKLDTLSLTTDILVGVGAAAVVTGTVLWVVGRPDREERASNSKAPERTSVGFLVGPRSLALSGRF